MAPRTAHDVILYSCPFALSLLLYSLASAFARRLTSSFSRASSFRRLNSCNFSSLGACTAKILTSFARATAS